MERRTSTIGEGGSRSYDQAMADGRTLAVSINSMSEGRLGRYFSDVTEQRRLEAERAAMMAELQQQNLRFDAALDNMAHGLCVYDKDWRVIVRNRRYLELYGLRPDDAQPGTPLVELMRHSIDARRPHDRPDRRGVLRGLSSVASTIDREPGAASPPDRTDG